MYRLTLNTLISLIVRAKITGKGKTGNGRIFIRLLSVIADCQNPDMSKERNMLAIFSNHVNKQTAYQKINRFLFDFLPMGKGFLSKKITMQMFETKVNLHGKTQWKAYRGYLADMGDFCEQILEKEKISAFVNTLLELLKQEHDIKTIFYGGQFIPKEQLQGTPEQPKKICTEALLLGILYQTLKNFSPADAREIQLLDSESSCFQIIQLGTKENPVFWGDCEELKKLLNPEMYISVKEHLKSYPLSEETCCYPLEIHCQEKEILLYPENGVYPPLLAYQEKKNILVYASGGFGKSFLLRHQTGLFLSLGRYREEIRKEINPEVSSWILIQILLKYHYHYAYQTYELCTACQEEKTLLREIAELLALFRNLPENQIPEYTLLLDGMNEMTPELQDSFAEELETICHQWQNVRIIITSRNLPEYEVFQEFEKLEITGIPEHIRDSLLSDYPETMRNEKLLKILKAPLFMKYFLQNQGTHDALNTRGEILDAYFTNEIKKYEKPFQFVIKYAVPFLAHAVLPLDFKRSDISDAIEQAFRIYLHDEHIYQNFIAPDKFRKHVLLKAKDVTDFAELLIEKTGILTVIDNTLQFSHQYIYAYFAARYILNAVHAAESNRTQETFEKLGLETIRQKLSDEPYLLLGDICGDYHNIPDETGFFEYHRTELDTLLDMAREFHADIITVNVMRTMSFSRNRLICSADFSDLMVPMFLSGNLKFSDNGNYPCNFRRCRIYYLPKPESDIFCAAFSSDGKKVLLGMEDSHVILFDIRAGRVLHDYPLHSYLKYPECFQNIAFLNHDTQFTVATENTRFLIETATGTVLEYRPEKNALTRRAFARSPDNLHFLVGDSICSVTGERKKIQFKERYNHFQNCDFRNAVYLFNPEKNRKILHQSDAVTE